MRVAGTEDFEDVKRLAVCFYKASPYADLCLDDAKISALITEYLTSNPKDKIVFLAEENGKAVGILAAAALPFLLNSTDRIAAEAMWFLEPEHRKGRKGLQLLDAFEYWGTEIAKCSILQLARLRDSAGIEKIYDRRGYDAAEYFHIKKVN